MISRKSLVSPNAALTLLLSASGLVTAHDLWLVPALFSVAPGARVTIPATGKSDVEWKSFWATLTFGMRK